MFNLTTEQQHMILTALEARAHTLEAEAKIERMHGSREIAAQLNEQAEDYTQLIIALMEKGIRARAGSHEDKYFRESYGI